MATQTQYEYIENNIELVKEPIAIIGSKIYDYDQYDFVELLKAKGFTNIVGIDLFDGKNVDIIADVTDMNNDFFISKKGHFNTVICMSILMYVSNPFDAAANISKISNENATLILSEPFSHKSTSMPIDRWRFTFDSLKSVFKQYSFIDEKSLCSFTRSNITFKSLRDPSVELMYGQRHPDENVVAFYIRRVSLKLFAKRFFKLSRLMPEISIFAIAQKL